MARATCKTILLFYTSNALELGAIMVWHFPNSVGTHLTTITFYCISCTKSEVICSAGHQEGSGCALSKRGKNVLSSCPRTFNSNLKHAKERAK